MRPLWTNEILFRRQRENSTKTIHDDNKKEGDNGSPCLRPLVALNFPLCLPLMMMEKLVEEMQPLIQCLHLEAKPFNFNNSSRKSLSTLSKVFSMSNLMAALEHSWNATQQGFRWQ